jgi:ribosomal-protein-alanine N-acetyltransferase
MKPVVETERLTLKILDATMAESVLKYYLLNRAFLEPWEPKRNEGFYTFETQFSSLVLDAQAMDRGEMLRYWIYLKDGTGPIGTIALTNIIRGVFKSCLLGYKLSENYGGKGYMTEAIEKIVDIAFKELKLHRIEANIMPHNIRSRKSVEKLGFKEEGLSEKYLKINDKWEDHYRFTLINQALDV